MARMRRFGMPMIGLKRVLAGLAVLALAAGALQALSAQSAPSPGDSLTGELLIASPEMGDPRFDHAVILIVRHDASGARGIIVNRPATQSPIAELLQAIGEVDTAVDGTISVSIGGPVELGVGFVVHSADYRLPGTIDIDGHVAATSDPQILR